MKFEEVIDVFKEGKEIRRKGWIPGASLDREWCGDIFSAEDILSDDWEIIV